MDAGDTVWWDLGGTWNPVGGCKPVSTECANCYAAIQAGTLHQSAGAKREMRLLYDGVVDKRGGRYWFNGKPTELPRGHSSWNFPLDWPGADHPLLGATASPR
jgi:protein gp37